MKSNEMFGSLEKVKEFISNEVSVNKRKVVIITSGGTYVPLEKSAVRCIENFSTGTRGAYSAEYFLKSGFSVVFFHRKGTNLPFIVDCPSKYEMLMLFTKKNNIYLQEANSNVINLEKLIQISNELEKYLKNLFLIEFSSINDYFCGIDVIATHCLDYENNVIFYLSAAVSDFYIPDHLLPKDKISVDSELLPYKENTLFSPSITLELYSTPKSIQLIRNKCSNSFLVMFKLETSNEEHLYHKSVKALQKYNANIVCANLLQTRRDEVIILTVDNKTKIYSNGVDPIEKFIVDKIVDIYRETNKF